MLFLTRRLDQGRRFDELKMRLIGKWKRPLQTVPGRHLPMSRFTRTWHSVRAGELAAYRQSKRNALKCWLRLSFLTVGSGTTGPYS
jgi:hypothetical protein